MVGFGKVKYMIVKESGKAWVAQLGKHLILDFGSGHGLQVVRSSPELGSALSAESA